MEKRKILVLYAEVMPYNVVCFKALVKMANVEIHVITWGEEKKLTPYHPSVMKDIFFFNQKEFDAKKIISLINHIKPVCLYVAGRMEKDYLVASKYARSLGIKVIGTSDNQYNGSIKQSIAKLFSAKLYHQYFDYMMVPGLYQYEYARYLGFSKAQILFPQYCADTTLFNSYYKSEKESKGIKNNILFVGRLNKIKGIDLLVKSFLELIEEEEGFNLNLIIVGNGPERESIPKHERIFVHEFLDQPSIIKLLPNVRFLCLPSIKEPWGVVIHEFAAAGLPILTTNNCGAATAFVKNHYNGVLVEPENKGSLKGAIKYMASLSEEEIETMQQRSYELSLQITPNLWATTIKSVAGL